jgi:hypothetical protein
VSHCAQLYATPAQQRVLQMIFLLGLTPCPLRPLCGASRKGPVVVILLLLQLSPPRTVSTALVPAPLLGERVTFVSVDGEKVDRVCGCD